MFQIKDTELKNKYTYATYNLEQLFAIGIYYLTHITSFS